MGKTKKTIADIELPSSVPLTLRQMFLAREVLSEKYIDKGVIGKHWKFAGLNEVHEQDFLRTEMGFLQEEIFEALEELRFGDNRVSLDEEHADVLHFWLELLLYSGIDYHWLENYFNALYAENNLEYPFSDVNELLHKIMIFCQNKVVIPLGIRHRISVDTATTMPERWGLIRSEIDLLIVDCLHYMNKARNQLKNKYWKTSTTLTNTEQYQKLLIESFLQYISYLVLLGYNHEVIAKVFLKKNIINIERNEGTW